MRSPEADRTIEAWNDLGLRPVKKLFPSSKRYQNLVKRIEENGIDDVLQAIQKIKDSSYLQGKTENSRMVELEWFVDPDNFSKVLEGYYDDSERRQQTRESNDKPWTEWVKENISKEQRMLDRFCVLHPSVRREMEEKRIIVGQNLYLENLPEDGKSILLNCLRINGVEIREDEKTDDVWW